MTPFNLTGKNILYNGLAVALVLAMVLTALHFRPSDSSSEAITPPTNDYAIAVHPMVGRSMEQYGLYEGKNIVVTLTRSCLPGENCLFMCLSSKCNIDGSEPGYDVRLTKRLVSIESGCYWFEGNPEPWIEGGKQVTSFDSSTFGCLQSDEFEMIGVVKPL